MRSSTILSATIVLSFSCLCASEVGAAPPVGYHRQPALHGETLLFVAEGDLWKVPVTGGVATRLTSHPGYEGAPAISPDGETVAFTAGYEGRAEIYTMPLEGGLPTRRTYGTERVDIAGWTPDGRLLYSTEAYSTLPNTQLVILDPRTEGPGEPVPLAQAADGSYDDDGKTLYFTRLRFQGSHTKRYKGGTAQNIWRFSPGGEAVPLTTDYAGTSKLPMWWSGRVYFVSDRDGTMNLWSMSPDGKELEQLTRHKGWEIQSPDLQDGRIVYQLGADLRLYDIAASKDQPLSIALHTDLDQMREHWITDPSRYLTSAHVSPDGDRLVLTARGRVFVAPRKQGRFVEVTRKEGVRYREARFMPDGDSLVALSDESGEVELWKLPADGVGKAERWTRDGEVLRWDALPSPNGRYVAHDDKHQRLFVLDTEKGKNREIAHSKIERFGDRAWSPDSQWLAYVEAADNLFAQIKLYNVNTKKTTTVTSDRYYSYAPAWSPDGKWLYFLSDRNLRSLVPSPWGAYQPEPFLDKRAQIFLIALTEGLRSPFAPDTELVKKPAEDDETDDDNPESEGAESDSSESDNSESDNTPDVRIDLDGIETRLRRLPVPPGNYRGLEINDEALFWRSTATDRSKIALLGAKITNERDKKGHLAVETVAPEITDFELSENGKKLLVRKGKTFHIVDAKPEKASLDKSAVDLSAWKFSIVPREEWRQMFDEAWRLERDYFYDQEMHGVDWKAVREKYRPLVDRVTTRGELANLLEQMVSELSALHTFVYGGEHRSGVDDVKPSSLGAALSRDEAVGGYRVTHVYASDPDRPERAAPLAQPDVDVGEGDVIEAINGLSTLSVPDVGVLLRDQAGRQVRLRVQPAGEADSRDVIARPISIGELRDLRYHEWEYTRRLLVEEEGEGGIGYVHLRAMGGGNFTEWARGFYPVFTRKGLIVDVRHNRGGNIDSWILNRLLRRIWFYWSQHEGRGPIWNMQYAFGGHVVVLCDERTASDGEAFTEGIRRLGIGTIIGTRTWGGEIWLSSNNFLVDRGIATAAEYGVFSPEGEWLIEGHGVEPDIVVDNLPHETFHGRDAQLEAALEFLKKKIAEDPMEVPGVPPHPDLSFP